jgi:hypothetical protein
MGHVGTKMVYITQIMDESNVIVVRPMGGLCNKLRVIFSYWEHAKLNNKNVIVIWEVSDECPGFFLDYFEPVNGINFITNNNGLDLKIDYTGFGWHPDFIPYKKFLYADLKLKSNLMNRVTEKLKILGEFIAIQVRRTDHQEMAIRNNKFTSDEEFCKFIDNNPSYNLFITADNKNSFDYFKNLYTDKVKIDFPKDDPTKLRHTSLEDSIVDMFVCINSKYFKKSGYSSFGGTIDQLRNYHLQTSY